MKARALLILLATGCSTLAEIASGDQNLPSSGGGPFRKLQGPEAHGAPYLLDELASNYRQPSALQIADTEVALYVVAHDKTSGKDVIARTHALDGRTFYGATQDFGHKPQVVLADPTADLSHPSAVRADGIRLYYTKNGAVGLARSPDGLVFTEGPTVLAGPIDSASVALLPDQSFRMLFARSGAIFEARSTDGDSFIADAAPVLTAGTTFDAFGVSDPYLFPRVTEADRLQFRVLYTGTSTGDDAGGTTTSILFAARYADSGPFVRATTPAYAVGKNERSPSVLEWDSGTFLYVDQDQTSQGTTYRAIAGGVAPASITLSPPGDFPTSP